MTGVANELSIFVSACLLGNFICLVYCAIRVFRRIVKHSLLWVSIEDFLFWIGAAAYLFTEMYRLCAGAIRWYFVLGVMSGAVITISILCKMKKMVDKKKKTR